MSSILCAGRQEADVVTEREPDLSGVTGTSLQQYRGVVVVSWLLVAAGSLGGVGLYLLGAGATALAIGIAVVILGSVISMLWPLRRVAEPTRRDDGRPDAPSEALRSRGESARAA